MRERNESMKSTEGKLRYELVPAHIFEGIALGYEEGAQKYEVDDWRKLDADTLFGAALRHIQAVRIKGEILDPDTHIKIRGVDVGPIQHLYKAMAALSMVAEFLRDEMEATDKAVKEVKDVDKS